MFSPDLPYNAARSPVMADNIVSTSQPLAASAGIEMLQAGGNAVDAAIAAAMALTVVEPSGNGLGSDAFAIVGQGPGTELVGLNASGRAPAAWTPERFAGRSAMDQRGWESVTVPGAVSGWTALSERFGTLPFTQLAQPAIRLARGGFHVTPKIGRLWKIAEGKLAHLPGFAEAFLPKGRAPEFGDRFSFEDQARSLEEIAETKGESFYRGALAEKMATHAAEYGGGLSRTDLENHTADWVTPLQQRYEDVVLHEIPPNGQGIAALMALGILEARGGAAVMQAQGPDGAACLHLQIEAMKLALADLYAHVGDIGHMRHDPATLLHPDYLAERARLIDPAMAGDPGHGIPPESGTVYIAAADASGMMVSFIQSNYEGFGSGVVVPGTGISLQNRGSAFTLQPGHPNRVGPGKRPFHTIIPAFLTDRNGPAMAFGVMGGPIQAQGHLQMVLRTRLFGQNPQAASDAPRWRVLEGRQVAVEPTMPRATVEALRARGHDVRDRVADSDFSFGGAQLIHRLPGGGYIAGSDHRKDGCAVGF